MHGCATQSIGQAPANPIRTIYLRSGAPGTGLGAVPRGTYGFYARAFDASCGVVAAGCKDWTLVAGGSGELPVIATGMAGPIGCDAREMCVDGACMALDAGMTDGGGHDAGAMDGGVPDAGAMDGGGRPDAGTTTAASTMRVRWTPAACPTRARWRAACPTAALRTADRRTADRRTAVLRAHVHPALRATRRARASPTRGLVGRACTATWSPAARSARPARAEPPTARGVPARGGRPGSATPGSAAQGAGMGPRVSRGTPATPVAKTACAATCAVRPASAAAGEGAPRSTLAPDRSDRRQSTRWPGSP